MQLLPEEESDLLSKLFDQMVPTTEWGKVDWDRINNKIFIGDNPYDVAPALEKLLKKPVDKNVFIAWSTEGIPVIKTDLDAIANSFEDVSMVCLDKFIFNPTQGYIVEANVGDEFTVGLVMPVLPDA